MNNNNTLPLDSTKIKTVAVIGPNGNATTTMQGNYYGNPPYLISPVEGIGKFAQVTYVEGCQIALTNASDFPAACSAASLADAVVMVMGLDQTQEAEGNDRINITFPGLQLSLIQTVAGCILPGTPLIVVVMAGGTVDLTQVKETSQIGAIMWVGYPGQSGGTAIANVIFGEYNPGGRMPYTMYPADYVNEILMTDMDMRPNSTINTPGRTYRFYTGEPVYPFGTGLSYTNFSYSTNQNKQ